MTRRPTLPVHSFLFLHPDFFCIQPSIHTSHLSNPKLLPTFILRPPPSTSTLLYTFYCIFFFEEQDRRQAQTKSLSPRRLEDGIFLPTTPPFSSIYDLFIFFSSLFFPPRCIWPPSIYPWPPSPKVPTRPLGLARTASTSSSTDDRLYPSAAAFETVVDSIGLPRRSFVPGTLDFQAVELSEVRDCPCWIFLPLPFFFFVSILFYHHFSVAVCPVIASPFLSRYYNSCHLLAL